MTIRVVGFALGNMALFWAAHSLGGWAAAYGFLAGEALVLGLVVAATRR